jgi:hypothetical protein
MEMRPAGSKLRLNINRLTIDGGTHADARRVRAAIERKLTEMVNAAPETVRLANARMARIDGGTVRAGSTPDEIGSHLATRIFQGLKGGRRA